MDSRRRAKLAENNHHPNTAASTQEIVLVSEDARACESCGRVPGSRSEPLGSLDAFPAGVKFDPSDEELLRHLRDRNDTPHPLINAFISVLDGEDGICQMHPKHLPGVKKDGSSRHFFHKPAKAYTTGTRKRRKIHSEDDEPGVETRWHKTGKTRKVSENGQTLGWKKIMVLYRNTGAKKSKPEKTNWILHQYHLGETEEETDGELVVCKVFYQKQPRQGTGGRQAEGLTEVENVDLNQGSKDISGICVSEVSRGTPVTPKVDTPQRPRSMRADAAGRPHIPAHSSKGSELTVVGTEGQAAAALELTSTPAPNSTELPALTPAGTSFRSGHIMSPAVKTLQPTIAEGGYGEWNAMDDAYEEVSTTSAGKSYYNETDIQVGGEIGPTQIEQDEPHQFQEVFEGESQMQYQAGDDFICEEQIKNVNFSLNGGCLWEEFSNPLYPEYPEWPDLNGSFPSIEDDLRLSWHEVDCHIMPSKLDNDDSLSST